MKKNTVLFAGIFSLFVLLTVSVESCHKDEDTKAIITVVDALGNPVSSATVILHQDSVTNPSTNVKASVRQEQLTGSSGTAEFIFPLEAYLDIDASKGTLSGEAFVRLKQGETVSQTVVIR